MKKYFKKTASLFFLFVLILTVSTPCFRANETNIRFNMVQGEEKGEFELLALAQKNSKDVSLVGKACITLYDEEEGRYIELATIEVHPNYRKIGIGREMVNRIFNFARCVKAEEILLDVYFRDIRFEKNVKWYEFLGFKIVNKTFDYVSMSKKFN